MTHWKLTLSYDGSPFHGWQVQPGRATVQGTLAEAIERLAGERVLPQGSGRTDAGVHALAQVASFALDSPIPPANLLRALNRTLPPSIRVLSAEIATPNFHARHSALRKTYEYRIFDRRPPSAIPANPVNGIAELTKASGPRVPQSALNEIERISPLEHGITERVPHVSLLRHGFPKSPVNTAPDRICPPFLAPFVWDCRFTLDLARLQQAAAHILGTHDFTSFAASDPDLTARASSQKSAVILSGDSRNASPREAESKDPDAARAPATAPHLSASNLLIAASNHAPATSPNPIMTLSTSTVLRENDLLLYRVTGSGFLHHMVRNIVGTLVEIGRGSLAVEAIPGILAARNRSAAGPTAPANGLFLVGVDYPQPEAAESPQDSLP